MRLWSEANCPNPISLYGEQVRTTRKTADERLAVVITDLVEEALLARRRPVTDQMNDGASKKLEGMRRARQAAELAEAGGSDAPAV
jgi:hypothetical protein